MGRPSSYTPEIADRICSELSSTDKGLERICAADEMPNPATVYRWLEQHPEFREKYARARESQADFLATQTIAIADDGERDRTTRLREDGSQYEQVDQEHIQRSRLRVDARKWLASKLAPKKYGDKVQLAGDPENPVAMSLTVELVGAKPTE